MDRTPCWIFFTEALRNLDIRNYSAKQAEIFLLLEQVPVRIVDRKDVPRSPNIIGARFANVLKNAGKANEIPKVRYVAQGTTTK